VTRRLLLAPSILTANFGRIADEIASVAEYVDWFHLDVMDGHYVNNITFGPSLVAAVRKVTDRPFHVHLMITDPLQYAPEFVRAGVQRISFHPETVPDTAEAIAEVAGLGVGVGLAIPPDLDVEVCRPHIDNLAVVLVMTVYPGFGGQKFLDEVVPKITSARRMIEESGASADVEVDGGVNSSTLERVVEAGASILVAGSAIYDGVDAPAAARRLRERIRALETREQ
jgi:ribulose-phosphate 3-epimerase